MITFNIQAHNGNYYRGHAPSNSHGNCWCGKVEDALVLTIEQAREIVRAWGHSLKIIIAVSETPLTDAEFNKELFCIDGEIWHNYLKDEE